MNDTHSHYLLKPTLQYRQVSENGIYGSRLDYKADDILMVI